MNHDIKNLKEGENSNIRLKVKWEKVDIDLYKALTDQSIDALNKTTRTLNDTEHLTAHSLIKSNKYFFLLFVFSLLRSSFRSPPIII
jgi:hypothetical protein